MKDVEMLAGKIDVEAVKEEQVEISPYQGTNIQFTSGTTGKPKATLLAHRSLVNNTRQVSKIVNSFYVLFLIVILIFILIFLLGSYQT